MGKHENLPFHIYVNVCNSFLGPQMPKGVTRGIWHGIYAREFQTLMCHVFLESGAHWSGLPLHAISTSKDFSVPREQLQPWGSMGSQTEVWHAHYLEGLRADIRLPAPRSGRHTGIVIDWADGFSRYPQEHKPLNLIELDSGQFALIPNNYASYGDSHFVNAESKANMKFYRRGEDVYWEGGDPKPPQTPSEGTRDFL
jgi:hypothetical protein